MMSALTTFAMTDLFLGDIMWYYGLKYTHEIMTYLRK